MFDISNILNNDFIKTRQFKKRKERNKPEIKLYLRNDIQLFLALAVCFRVTTRGKNKQTNTKNKLMMLLPSDILIH